MPTSSVREGPYIPQRDAKNHNPPRFPTSVADLMARRDAVRKADSERAKAAHKNARPKRPGDPYTEAAKLRAENRKLRKRLRDVVDSPKGTLIISAADVKKIRRCLHPDTETDPVKEKRLTEASQIFNGLRMHDVDLD